MSGLLFPLVVLGGGWLVMRQFATMEERRDDFSKMSAPSLNSARLPHLLRDDVSEKSFAANQRHNTVRMPFGPNPQTSTIADQRMLNWPQYRQRYQGNLHMMTVENQDWRLDGTMSSPLNNYVRSHMAEPYDSFLIPQNTNSRTPAPQFIDSRSRV